MNASRPRRGIAASTKTPSEGSFRPLLRDAYSRPTEGEPDILTELVESFFEDVPPHLMILRKAVKDGNASLIEQEAHTLKGSCGNIGAVRMAAICAQLQENGTSTRVPELLDRLEAEFERVHSDLKAKMLGKT